jgi:hypothetical protein
VPASYGWGKWGISKEASSNYISTKKNLASYKVV